MPMPEISAGLADQQEASLQEAVDRLSNQVEYLVQRTTTLRALYNKASALAEDYSAQLDALTVEPDAPIEGDPEAPPDEALGEEAAALVAAADASEDGSMVLDEALPFEGHSETPAQPEE